MRSFTYCAASPTTTLCYDGYTSGTRERVPCEDIVTQDLERLQGLPKLKRLTLCNYEYLRAPNLDGPKPTILEWSFQADGKRHIAAADTSGITNA